MTKHSHASHVPPPARVKTAGKPLNVTREAVGAGLAATVGLVWLLAPGFKTAPAESPEMPEAPANGLPMPAPAAKMKAVEAAPARVEAPARAEQRVEVAREEVPVQIPAWVAGATRQEWVWPKHIQRQGDDETIDKKLVGWYPANAAEKRLLYSVTVDRKETRLYEDELPAFIARENARIAAKRAQEEFSAEQKRLTRGSRAPTARVQNTIAAAAPAATVAGAAAAPALFGPRGARGARGANAAQVANPVQFANAPLAAAIGRQELTPAEIAAQRAEFLEMLKEIRTMERARMVKNSNGAILNARDVTPGDGLGQAFVEITYANGNKEVVPYDPLVFDLKGTGIKTSVKKVLFDLFGFGKSDKTQWMNDLEEGTGVLVFDAKGTGKAGKNGSEVFGDRTSLAGVGKPDGYADGFEALRALAEKAVKEGVIGREALATRVLDAKALKAMEKAYGLKMKVGGMNREPISLEAAGIEAIALSREATQRAIDFDGQSNDLVVQPGAVFLRKDGTTGSYMNVWLSAKIGSLGLKTGKHMNVDL
ncbi:MAG: hypothetical protein HY923_01110 [Elusimicrobia bacterium]|nr:hypothetical protein [Elusimicrobiota bacterium]